jgi:hypothetical protein
MHLLLRRYLFEQPKIPDTEPDITVYLTLAFLESCTPKDNESIVKAVHGLLGVLEQMEGRVAWTSAWGISTLLYLWSFCDDCSTDVLLVQCLHRTAIADGKSYVNFKNRLLILTMTAPMENILRITDTYSYMYI